MKLLRAWRSWWGRLLDEVRAEDERLAEEARDGAAVSAAVWDEGLGAIEAYPAARGGRRDETGPPPPPSAPRRAPVPAIEERDRATARKILAAIARDGEEDKAGRLLAAGARFTVGATTVGHANWTCDLGRPADDRFAAMVVLGGRGLGGDDRGLRVVAAGGAGR